MCPDSSLWTNSTYLQAWFNGTHWYSLGLFIGGGNAGTCAPPANIKANLQYAWNTIGWTVESFFYGWQMPYPTCQDEHNTDVWPYLIGDTLSDAANDGEGAANNAASVAHQDGFAVGATIYFDLEEVLPKTLGNGVACDQLAQTFISYWDSTLEYDGFSPGLYAPTCAGQIQTFVGSDPVLAAIAPADNNDDPTGVYGLACLSDGYWNNNQRIHQLAAQTNDNVRRVL